METDAKMIDRKQNLEVASQCFKAYRYIKPILKYAELKYAEF